MTMILIFMLTSLATTVKGVIQCNFTETSEGPPCVGAVGQRLIFHLWNTPNTDITLVKDDQYRILKKSKDTPVSINEEYVEAQRNSQSEFSVTGDLVLGLATVKHSGSYIMEEFSRNGKLLKKAICHLQIQAPVSQPAVSQLCVSPGQMKVSCSSEGDAAELSLSLGDRLLIESSKHNLIPSNCTGIKLALAESRDDSNVSHVTVCLRGQLTGNLTCTARNGVSRHDTLVPLKDCEDFISSFLVVTVALTAGVSLLLLVAFCLGIKKWNHKPRHTAINESNNETDIFYAEVTVIRNVKRNTEVEQKSTYVQSVFS